MKSRALPEDFDFTRSLQSPYGDQTPAVDTSFQTLDMADRGHRSMLPLNHEDITSSHNIPIGYNVPSESGPRNGLINQSSFTPTHDAAQFPDLFHAPRGSSIAGTPSFRSPYVYSNELSGGPHIQRRIEAPLQQSAGRVRIDPLLPPTAHSGHQFAVDTHPYSDRSGSTPRLPLMAGGASSPSATLQNQNFTEYSEAAGSAGYALYSSYQSKSIDNRLWQAAPDNRLTENEQKLIPSHPQFHPPSPPYPNEYAYTHPQAALYNVSSREEPARSAELQMRIPNAGLATSRNESLSRNRGSAYSTNQDTTG